MWGPREGSLYILYAEPEPKAMKTEISASMLQIWHERLGHASISKMKQFAKMNVIRGLNSSCFSNEKTF